MNLLIACDDISGVKQVSVVAGRIDDKEESDGFGITYIK